MKKQPSYNVPFSHVGLHDYPDWSSCYRGQRDPKTWKYEIEIDYKAEIPEIPAFSFEATLEYQNHSRGRSAATFWFKSIDGEHVGKTFPVQMGNMSSFIPKLEKGKITAKFFTRKQGQNFGLELA